MPIEPMAASGSPAARLELDRREYLFDLPHDRIAQRPPEAEGRARSDARLLVAQRGGGVVEHRQFTELTKYLRPGDAFVVNDARVVPSLLRGHDEGGEPVVVQIFSPTDDGSWHCMVLPDSAARAGAGFEFGGGLRGALLHEEEEHVWRLALDPDDPELLGRVGEFPFSWYFEAPPDPETYQTIYAVSAGATGLPSAGRHLTPELLDEIAALGVELVRVRLDIAVRWTYEGFRVSFWDLAKPGADAERPPHMSEAQYAPPRPERYRVTLAAADTINACRRAGGRIVVCGTSALRTLETVTDEAGRVYPGTGWTAILISPGHRFRACDAFLTNFHMPMSTELLLTAAVLGGRDELLGIYRDEVLPGAYEFNEFGDSMLIMGEARTPIAPRPELEPDPAGEDPRHGITGG